MSCQCHKVPGYVLLRFGNVVSNGAISIKQWGFINERFKVNPVGQWGKILVMAMRALCTGMEILAWFLVEGKYYSHT